ncbi:MAG: hypothetical protein ACRC2T_20825, partial [Thermoguttaceae bacterium]
MDAYDEISAVLDSTDENSPLAEELSAESIGLWNRLISRTNWDKGELIYRWRTRLQEAGLPNSAYSDESWARRVGNVSPQHVGRLRRVYERFGDNRTAYPTLFWSHFQAALDWDEADMWLEGAVQNGWSVANMRITRWETLGAPADMKPREQDVITAEMDEDINPFNDSRSVIQGKDSPISSTGSGVSEFDADAPFDVDDDSQPKKKSKKDAFKSDESDDEILSTGEVLTKLNAVKELPSDLCEAFEQMKVAILNHKLT